MSTHSVPATSEHPALSVMDTEAAASTAPTDHEEVVKITEAAAVKIAELAETMKEEDEDDSDLKLRVYIEGGGCSGFKYEFAFDSIINEDDTIIRKTVPPKNNRPLSKHASVSQKQGASEHRTGVYTQVHEDSSTEVGFEKRSDEIILLIDAMSLQYLIGAEIDYQSGIEERFIIRNPNARTTCGCGSSFSVD
ncbi:MAG: iron-sulfur cluster insertion protein ErpA [Legionellales bacterium]|nr:iron-sulfur cluster insertion protein ErpA [Legionellales bacterium]